MHNLGSLGETEILIEQKEIKGCGVLILPAPLIAHVFPDDTATSLSYSLPNYQNGITLLNGVIKK